MKIIDVTFEMEVKTSKLLILVFAIRFLDIWDDMIQKFFLGKEL